MYARTWVHKWTNVWCVVNIILNILIVNLDPDIKPAINTILWILFIVSFAIYFVTILFHLITNISIKSILWRYMVNIVLDMIIVLLELVIGDNTFAINISISIVKILWIFSYPIFITFGRPDDHYQNEVVDVLIEKTIN